MSNLQLYDYQKDAMRFMLRAKAGYLMLDMGTGKTAIAISWFKRLPKTKGAALVVAPLATALNTWPIELEKWSSYKYTVLHGKDKDERLHANVTFFIINYDGLSWLFNALKAYTQVHKKMPFSTIIIDEGSCVKSWKTKRFKILKQLVKFCPNYRLILSGTPAPNGLIDLWSQYYLLDYGERLEPYITRYKAKYFTPVGYKGYKHVVKTGCSSLIYEAIEDITYRLDASDILDLPDMRYNTILVTLPKKVQELYKQLQSDLIVEFEKASENKEEIVVAEYAGALLMKLRQICQGAIYLDDRSTKYLHQVKLDMLASILETGVRVLCPIQFKFDLTIIQKKYPNAPYIGGGLSAANTKKLITQWNNKQIPLLLCHPLSLSHGVNLQFGSNVIVWYSLPWSLEQYQQLNKRLHRIGQKETVIIHHILAKGTVDEQVLKALKSKENVQDSLLNYFKNLER